MCAALCMYAILNCLNHVDTPSGKSRHWPGTVPKGPQLWSHVCTCACTYLLSGTQVCLLCFQAHPPVQTYIDRVHSLPAHTGTTLLGNSGWFWGLQSG